MRWLAGFRNSVLAACALPMLTCVCSAHPCAAQQLIGYVPTRDANVTGSTDELDGQAVLMGSASVTAKDHTAPIKLSRGGTVRVCQTSALKITESREVAVSAPLLFSLDRGAIEIETNGTPNDSIMTPDLRFTIRNTGPLDLRMRVARNGDTCVENRGATAPTLAVSDAFGESMYELPAGQHVLFEHGSLREVVDHESTPCGCPDKGSSMAEAMLAPGSTKAGRGQESSTPAAAQHPFPMAQSAGLAPVETAGSPEPAPAPHPGTPQISDVLSYSAGMKDPDELSGDAVRRDEATLIRVKAAAGAVAQTSSVAANGALPVAPLPVAPAAPVMAPQAAEQPQVNDLVHVIGRAFRKLFGRG
jgi:hypothetical protein